MIEILEIQIILECVLKFVGEIACLLSDLTSLGIGIIKCFEHLRKNN